MNQLVEIDERVSDAELKGYVEALLPRMEYLRELVDRADKRTRAQVVDYACLCAESVFHLLGDADTCARSAVAAARAWIIEPTVANTDAANAAANALPARIITQTASWQAKANASAVNAAWYAARTVFDLVVLPVDHAHAAERCASVALKAECSARVRGATTTIL